VYRIGLRGEDDAPAGIEQLEVGKRDHIVLRTKLGDLLDGRVERGDDFWRNVVLCREERPRISQLEGCRGARESGWAPAALGSRNAREQVPPN
jgi:hypothetical protein